LLGGCDRQFRAGVVFNSLAQSGKHFIRSFSGGADDENVAKLLLVGPIQGREGVDGFVIDVSSRAGLDGVLSRLDSDPAAYRRGTPPPAGQMRSANEQADELAMIYRQVAGHAR